MAGVVWVENQLKTIDWKTTGANVGYLVNEIKPLGDEMLSVQAILEPEDRT